MLSLLSSDREKFSSSTFSPRLCYLLESEHRRESMELQLTCGVVKIGQAVLRNPSGRSSWAPRSDKSLLQWAKDRGVEHEVNEVPLTI